MTNARRIAAGLCVVMGLAAGIAWAEDAATAPATAPATSAPAGPIAATDKQGIEDAFGKEVTITGKVARATWIPSGSICFINFEGNERGDFVAIIKKANHEAVDKGFDGDVTKALTGKKVEIKGKITKYNETPQLEVIAPEQITIIAEAATEPAK